MGKPFSTNRKEDVDLKEHLNQISPISQEAWDDFQSLLSIVQLDKSEFLIREGDHVICAISGKKISLKDLNYWNVDLQEAYYSYKEASKKREMGN